MPVSTERPELTSFIRTWQGKPQEQVTEELASLTLETNRIPDPYYFSVTAGNELWSPVAHRKVRDIVERTNNLGEIEYQAFSAIEQWVKNGGEGVALWLSPPYPGIYPTSKIIISEIEAADGVKKLHNTAIVLDMGQDECLRLAQDLSRYSSNHPLLTGLGEVRATPLILENRGLHWTYILGEFIEAPQLWQSIREGANWIAKKEALYQASVAVQKAFFDSTMPLTEARVILSSMLGDKVSSCPVVFGGTAFQVFSGNALTIGTGSSFMKDKYGSLEFECPKCGITNRRPYGRLIPNCQHCGTDVRC